MYYVYVLLLNNGELYKGYSKDIRRRINEHKNGRVRATRPHRPLKLVHYECYLIKSDAKRREQYLKTNKGRRDLRRQIADLLRRENLYDRYKKEYPW